MAEIISILFAALPFVLVCMAWRRWLTHSPLLHAPSLRNYILAIGLAAGTASLLLLYSIIFDRIFPPYVRVILNSFDRPGMALAVIAVGFVVLGKGEARGFIGLAIVSVCVFWFISIRV